MTLQLVAPRVLAYLQGALPGLGLPRPNRLSIEQFKDGQSNPTYMLTCDTMKLVLRKAPPGNLLQGAHQVEREAHLMHAMKRSNSAVPLPEILLVEEDENVLGTKFFLMQYIEGTVYRKPTLPDQSAAERAAIYDGLAASLAAIHNTPINVVTGIVSVVPGGSAGFCRRQVDIWSRQYAHSVGAVSRLPQMQRVVDWLKQNIPYANDHAVSPILSVVHGDFRLDNLMYGNAGPQAVLDWELGGAGDGTMDLAYCCLGYYLPQEGFLSSFSMYSQGNTNLPPGIPSLEDFVAAYKARLTPDRACKVPSTTSAEWKFFLCLGLYRIASICAGVYSRAVQGNASRGNTALAFKDVVPQLAELALAIISAGSVEHPQAGVEPGGGPSAEARIILKKLHAFMEDCVLPNELKILEYNLTATGVWPERGNKWVPNPHMESLRGEARKRGLWEPMVYETHSNRAAKSAPHVAVEPAASPPSWIVTSGLRIHCY
jgi:aminoglycoside phosphotransferase (APT) family kinase protein